MPRQRSETEETLARRWRDTADAIKQLDRGELWHPMTKAEYRAVLLRTFDEIEHDLACGDDWRPDYE